MAAPLQGRSAQWLGVLLAAVVAGATWWLAQRNQPSDAPAVQPPDQADYYARDATIRTTNEQGSLVYRLDAAEILHFPDDSATMETVHLIYQTEAEPWDLTADRARIPTVRGQKIILIGHVVMQGALEDGTPITMKAPRMVVLTEDREAYTDTPVVVTGPGRRIDAVGMQADLDLRQVEFLNDVQVQYQP